MTTTWDDMAESWDGNEAVQVYAKQAFHTLQELVDLKGLRVLDFGCGTGLLTEKIAPFASTVVALDPSTKMIDALEQKQLANVATLASELSADLISGSELLRPEFDVIVASSALAFVDDYAATLGLLKRLLKRDGLLVQWDWLKAEDEAGEGFSKKQIQSAYDQLGFTGCTISTPFSLNSGETAMPVIMAVAQA